MSQVTRKGTSDGVKELHEKLRNFIWEPMFVVTDLDFLLKIRKFYSMTICLYAPDGARNVLPNES